MDTFSSYTVCTQYRESAVWPILLRKYDYRSRKRRIEEVKGRSKGKVRRRRGSKRIEGLVLYMEKKRVDMKKGRR